MDRVWLTVESLCVDLRFLERTNNRGWKFLQTSLLLFSRYYSALLRNRDSENDSAGRAPSTNVLSFNLLGGAAVGSNDGRMKEQAAGGERRGEGGKEEGRFWIFHKDPTRYSLPYENDTLPSLPPSLPPFLLFRSNQIRGSRGTKEWTRFFPRPRRRIHSCSRHFIGPSIINFRSGEICFSEELFLRSNPYLSYLEFHSYSSRDDLSCGKTCFQTERNRALEPSLFKISRGFRLSSPLFPRYDYSFRNNIPLKCLTNLAIKSGLKGEARFPCPPFFWSSLSSKWEQVIGSWIAFDIIEFESNENVSFFLPHLKLSSGKEKDPLPRFFDRSGYFSRQGREIESDLIFPLGWKFSSPPPSPSLS